MSKKITIEDVAERAGVSVGTVSRAINGHGAAPETREKVLKVAEELNYRMNLFARGVRGARKNCFGILVEGRISEEDPWLESIVLSMSRMIAKSGYHSMIDFWEGDDSKVPKMLGNIDGCMLVGNFPPEFFDTVEKQVGLPLVTYDEKMPYEKGKALWIDWEAGVYEAVGYLLALDHPRLGLIVAGLDYPSLKKRYDGYIDALPQYGRDVDEDVIKTTRSFGSDAFEEAYELTGELVDQNPDISAIIYGSDSMAVAGMQKLRAMGRRVPEDVSVIGFDDSAWARVTVPPLTTVGADYRELSMRMLETLRMLLGDRNSEPSLIIKPELIRRSSVKRYEKQ